MQISIAFITASAFTAVMAAPTATTNADLAPNNVIVERQGTGLPMPAYDVPVNHFCQFPGTAVSHGEAIDAINWFNDNQACTGPKSCKELDPGTGVKFTFCNDNAFNKCVDKSDIKWRGQQLLDVCAANKATVSGQAFFSDSTNLIIQGR